jgi:hypothetical protein
MRGHVAPWRLAGLFIGKALVLGATLVLGACSGDHHPLYASDADPDINAYPTNYKSDILGGMHAYLNDPTGIRDAAISAPALKAIGNGKLYVVCLQFNAKKNATEYAGLKTVAALFVAGRLDHFAEVAHEPCTGTTYTPFPELQKLPP